MAKFIATYKLKLVVNRINAFNLIVKLTAAFELKLIEKEERKSNYETKIYASNNQISNLVRYLKSLDFGFCCGLFIYAQRVVWGVWIHPLKLLVSVKLPLPPPSKLTTLLSAAEAIPINYFTPKKAN